MSMKNPMTPAGIEPTTFRIVAQYLNHCATAEGPQGAIKYLTIFQLRAEIQSREILNTRQ
jgi:hypothetical protein